MRHAIANLLYSLGAAIDRPRRRGYVEGAFGDERKYNGPETSSTSTTIHMRRDSRVAGNFTPGDFTYAAMSVGDGSEVTIFLNRTTTLKMISVLKEVDSRFREYGEGRHHD